MSGSSTRLQRKCSLLFRRRVGGVEGKEQGRKRRRRKREGQRECFGFIFYYGTTILHVRVYKQNVFC